MAPLAVSLWTFEGTTSLTYVFISSFFAASAASTLWVAASQSYGTLAGIGFDYVVTMIPLSIFLFQLGASSGNPRMNITGVVITLAALLGLGFIFWSIRKPIDRSTRMPVFVRFSFVLFIVALLIAAVELILRVPNIIPWKITPDLSSVIGFMFFGSVMYFLYGLVVPSWLNSGGQLASFLAYDLVLIGPLISRLPAVAPEQKISLFLYISVLIYSGLVAIYYLFLHKETRVWGRGENKTRGQAIR